QGLAKPEEILALTFTEKAAREMEERVDQALPYGTFGLWISTFHSFCDRILRAEALHIGLNPHYKLLAEAETYLLVKNNFWKFNLTHFRPTGNPYKFIEGMIQHFSRLKDEDVSVAEYKNKEYPELETAYKTYEDLKISEQVMDFSDLISYTLELFRERKNILARYQKQFKYILVDEFQDTNFAQNELVKLLATDNITVVCDDDQSIYRFRGAAISNVLQFKKDFPKAKIITLTQNYRSTQSKVRILVIMLFSCARTIILNHLLELWNEPEFPINFWVPGSFLNNRKLEI
ncbi:UvrD-helicase domain-containing protein, partial [Candidatus Gottesmanbacteria bacterium]|nr:UvrD-helicase domain-containing protein [Candidatus Gottesmanbacteria bacterium]